MSKEIPEEILAEIPEDLKKQIYFEARESGLNRFPVPTAHDAKFNHGYRMEHGLGFETGAKWMYSTHVLPLKEENERLKGLIEKAYDEGYACYDNAVAKVRSGWYEFKEENKL